MISQLPTQSVFTVLPSDVWEDFVKKISTGIHAADLWLPTDYTKPLSVAEVREMLRFTSRTGVGEDRLVVLPNADRMNAESANACLKLLEEPPAGVYFVLLTETAHLLPTVLSRVTALVPSGVSATMKSEGPWQEALSEFDLTDPTERQEAQRLLYLYPLVHQGIRHDLLLDRPTRAGSGSSLH